MPGGGWVEVALSERNGSAKITVSDNGTGVSTTDRSRLFEPFFSTKKNGAGMGLALARRFVEEAGGDISCLQSNASGSTFQIRLPTVQIS
jgi:signal transduction histidine kinase